jgi:hypothetical protein
MLSKSSGPEKSSFRDFILPGKPHAGLALGVAEETIEHPYQVGIAGDAVVGRGLCRADHNVRLYPFYSEQKSALASALKPFERALHHFVCADMGPVIRQKVSTD